MLFGGLLGTTEHSYELHNMKVKEACVWPPIFLPEKPLTELVRSLLIVLECSSGYIGGGTGVLLGSLGQADRCECNTRYLHGMRTWLQP